ncbi:MAG: hypothetical protein DSZ29_05005 [Aquificaceae bacterium]|nr:MAG: hypothetical protein DSZ29_05005 [Aquificaceae bacterium]
MSSFEHIKIVRTKNEIVWLTIDSLHNNNNALTSDLLKELKEVVISLKGKSFKGLVISSAKQDDFIAGTDLDILLSLNTKKKSEVFTSLGNQLCRHLKNLDCTTVALINGNCSNSGLDIALSCDIRIASDTKETLFSYHDIKQGHYAGFGGISYLIKHKGLIPALNIITHKSYLAPEALAIGLIDYIVPKHKFHQTAEYLIERVNEQQQAKPSSNWRHWGRKSFLPSKLSAYLAYNKQLEKTKNHSEKNAINSIIQTWKTYNTSPDAAHDEASSASKLLISDPVQQHLKLNKLYQQLDENITDLNPQTQHVHILGCGVMGRYLARLCAENGFLVSIYDTRQSALERLLPELYQYLDKNHPDSPKQQRLLDKIIIDIDNSGLNNADIIIEATPEEKHAKASLLHDIEQQIKSEALILTTTSSLPLDEISKGMTIPERLSLFNPYHPLFNSPIVEVSSQKESSDIYIIKSFAKVLKLKPIVVKNKAGYLGTRLLMTYINEAMHIHQSGISIQAIDKQTSNIGMSHAPFDLIDIIGIKECLTIAESLADRLDSDVPSILIQKNEQGQSGKNSGTGFYQYNKGKKQHSLFDKILHSSPSKIKNQKIEEKLIEKIINEARVCLQEEIAEKRELVDLIAIITTGFPTEKGGPLSYLDTL